jgi:hypothetical protein
MHVKLKPNRNVDTFVSVGKKQLVDLSVFNKHFFNNYFFLIFQF